MARRPPDSELAKLLRVQLREWLRLSKIEDSLASEIPTPNCLAWALACSPPDTTIDKLAVATMDLALWFVYLDDYAGADDSELYRACARILEGEQPLPGPFAILRLFADHHARISRLPAKTTRYVTERQRLLRAYELRNDAGRSNRVMSFDEYYQIRSFTTGIDWWMSVWALLEDFELTDAERALPAVDRAIRAVVGWFIFMNEARSVARDIASKTPNLVLIYAREHGTSHEEAAAHLDLLSKAALRDFDVAEAELRRDVSVNRNIEGMLSFLRVCLDGGAALYARRADRYRSSLVD